MRSPKVTVLMPVYNGEKYLKDAIESILTQDFTDFEFLIINDGSSDSSEKIIATYSDIRIRLLKNEKNIGLVNTLNKGLEAALGEYIVRMDCDDVSLKNRLTVQVNYMDKNTDIGACGSYYNMMIDGRKAVVDLPLNKHEMKSYMMFNCPISHPTAIIRSSVIRKEKLSYNQDYIHAEDYQFWSRLSECSNLANLPDVLLNYRMHENQITQNQSFSTKKLETLSLIRSHHLKLLNIVPSQEELKVHHLVSDGGKAESESQMSQTELWLKKIINVNTKTKQLDDAYLGKIVLERWLRMCFNFYGGTKGFKYFYNSEIYSEVKLPFKQKLELFKNLYNSYKRKLIKK